MPYLPTYEAFLEGTHQSNTASARADYVSIGGSKQPTPRKPVQSGLFADAKYSR